MAPKARVVVLTGFRDSLFGDRARNLGAAAFVEKGADPATLSETIRGIASPA